jgi:hypothetical protein
MTPDEFNQDSEDVFVNPIFENESCHWTDHEYETASWVNDIIIENIFSKGLLISEEKFCVFKSPKK